MQVRDFFWLCRVLKTHSEFRSHPEPLANLQSDIQTVVLPEDSPVVSDTNTTSSSVGSPVHLKRKRRLSDGEVDRPSKRPHPALCQPRLQTVSNPLPKAVSFPEVPSHECVQNNSISERHLSDSFPPPVNAEDLSQIASLEVDLHQYDLSPCNPGAAVPQSSMTSDFKPCMYVY